MLPIRKESFLRGLRLRGLGHVIGELGRLVEKDLEGWEGPQCVKCGKAGTGLQWGGTVLGKRPVIEEMMQRQMGQKGH